MRTSSLVGHVVEVTDIVRGGRRPADGVVREFFRTRHYLGSSDRRYIAERTYDILRHEDLLSAYCTGSGLTAPVSSVALAFTREVRLQDPSPDNEQLLADFGGIWRMMLPDRPCEEFLGRLRAAETPGDPAGDPVSFLALRHSLPPFIVADWLGRFGRGEAEELCAASNGGAPVTVRVNTLKCTRAMCQEALAGEGVGAMPTPVSPDGLKLQKRVNVPGLRSFKMGWFEMQDEGSQILTYLSGAGEGMTVLDACAGGGGKSLHAAALMNNRGRVIAADVDGKKLANFLERAARAGVSIADAVVVPEEGETSVPVLPEADVVLVDAPCSGVGTFRRSPWLKRSVTEESSTHFAAGQIRLLDLYSRHVRPGGRLVYSTCTLLRKENRDVVESFTASHPGFEELAARDILAAAGMRVEGGAGPSLELLPHRTGTDGFFAAVLRRRS